MQKNNFCVVGMPESGKTTYLISLCRMLINREKDTVLSLPGHEIPTELEYVNQLMERLDACEEVGRSTSDVHKKVVFTLLDEHNNEMELVLPDVSGEVFRDVIDKRMISDSILEEISSSDGILFFVNKDTMAEENFLPVKEKSALMQLKDMAGCAESVQESEKLQDSVVHVQPSREKANQSEVMDLLQLMVLLAREECTVKVIVSAWDNVEKLYGDILPQDYVKKEFPLIYQFLKNHSDHVYTEYWGVSAQGCDFQVKEEKQKLLDGNLYEYIISIDQGGKKNYDLTRLLCTKQVMA